MLVVCFELCCCVLFSVCLVLLYCGVCCFGMVCVGCCLLWWCVVVLCLWFVVLFGVLVAAYLVCCGGVLLGLICCVSI